MSEVGEKDEVARQLRVTSTQCRKDYSAVWVRNAPFSKEKKQPLNHGSENDVCLQRERSTFIQHFNTLLCVHGTVACLGQTETKIAVQVSDHFS